MSILKQGPVKIRLSSSLFSNIRHFAGIIAIARLMSVPTCQHRFMSVLSTQHFPQLVYPIITRSSLLITYIRSYKLFARREVTIMSVRSVALLRLSEN